MVVEPAAGDKLEDNLNPVSRMYYAASTMICVPTSLDQPVGAAFGARRLRKIIVGNYARRIQQMRKATETPFNMVLEARPTFLTLNFRVCVETCQSSSAAGTSASGPGRVKTSVELKS